MDYIKFLGKFFKKDFLIGLSFLTMFGALIWSVMEYPLALKILTVIFTTVFIVLFSNFIGFFISEFTKKDDYNNRM